MRISLVIPTRERAALLGPCLETALAVPDPDLEIVVSDNASTDGTADLLAAQTDPRLTAVSPGTRVSMRQNFEAGMAAATGDYVIFIGDDDGVTPAGLAMLRNVLMRHRPEAVSWEMIYYAWPSDRSHQGCGFFRIKPRSVYGGLEQRSPRRLIAEMCSARVRNYRETANIYHGCVSRELIERVKTANGGTYFAGAIPDVYACIANLIHMRGDLLWLGHPATFGGASDRSSGASQMAAVKTPVAGLDELRRFAAEVANDPGTAQIDISIPSVDALTLDMLDLVNKHHGKGRLSIDHRAWIDRILHRLSVLPRSKWEAGRAILAAYSTELGQTAMFDDASQRRSFSGPETMPEGGRPQRCSIHPFRITLAHPRGLATVRDAAETLDEVLGNWHRPGETSLGSVRWLSWIGALRRAARVARRWG
ncbi:MAG: glycosyltransferase family 2 protein [Alphaproteobacteria bacterium]|nr:glycosyltransferase family 2 protein [Alphaproteobacteria bacterium]